MNRVFDNISHVGRQRTTVGTIWGQKFESIEIDSRPSSQLYNLIFSFNYNSLFNDRWLSEPAFWTKKSINFLTI